MANIPDEAVEADIEWGTDYWGEIMSEPSEDHARKVALAGGANLYHRSPGDEWEKVAP